LQWFAPWPSLGRRTNRLDALNLRGAFRVENLVHVDNALGVEPKVRRRPERLRKTQRCVGRNTALTVYDLVQARVRHTDPFRESGLRKPERNEEFLNEDLAGGDGANVLAIVHEFNVDRAGLGPPEANAVLVVDANRMLSGSVVHRH